MTFANALTHPRGEVPMILLEGPGQPPPEALKLARERIRRWQTKAFAMEVRRAFRVRTAYELEKRLIEGEPDLEFPYDRPRLFDRMKRSGEPSISRYINGRLPPTSRRWIDKASKMAPGSLGVLGDCLWRLADPEPLGPLEWTELGKRHMSASNAVGIGATPFMVRLPNRSSKSWMIPHGLLGTRLGMGRALLQLRMYEFEGDLIGYFLSLLSIVERCRFLHADDSIEFMQAECERHVLDCFSRVYVLGSVLRWDEDDGLCDAHRAWLAVKDEWLGLSVTVQ